MQITDDLKKWIRFHEGYNPRLYKDTVGKLTIGYGRNIEDNGISREEAEFMLENDINRAINDIKKYDWFSSSPDKVQYALVNMSFNMGLSRLLGFKKMIAALVAKDYTTAAKEALDSKWAKQVGHRATDVSLLLRNET